MVPDPFAHGRARIDIFLDNCIGLGHIRGLIVSCVKTLNQTERTKNMGKSQIAVLLVAGMLLAAAGCEMGGLSDEAQLTAALGQWKAATEAQDIDKMMEPYSEDYEGDSGEGKEGVREFLSGMKD